jgi:hypothetical protein
MSIGSLVAVPLPNGAFGVIWILDDRGGRSLFFVVLDGFWSAIPRRVELRFMPQPLRDRPNELYDNVYKASFAGELPGDFVEIEVCALTPEARAVAADHRGTFCLQNAEDLRSQLYEQWRWLNDRAALEAERSKRYADCQAREAKRRQQQTLPKMLRERPFSHWPSKELMREARRFFKEATKALIDLQKEGTRKQRVAVLKRITTELNAVDDGSIESAERDEIVARVDELAALVGISNDDEELTGHRDW